MNRYASALQALLVALWAGGLWAIGYVAAPTLFAMLPGDRMLAGQIAGRLFALIAWIGMAAGFLLLINRLLAWGAQALKQAFFWVALLMLLLAVAGHFGIQPVLAGLKAQAMPHAVMESVFRDRFATWHGIASGVYLLQSLLALALVLLAGPAARGRR